MTKGKHMQVQQLTGRVIHKSMFISASPERVFQAFTTKEDLEKWFVREATVKLPPDGWLRLDWGNGDIGEGQISVYEPHSRFTFEWDEGGDRGASVIHIELTPEGDGTRLELAHSGHGDGDDWDRIFADNTEGWNTELIHLQRWVEDGTEKPW
jgi:uncharacterized protein YndB with AHSA1/START domain